jgi:2-dehydropantoate 2-reductase
MRFCVIGAGAMGCLYGGRLAHAGYDVTLVDVWDAHVSAINESGLLLDGIGGEIRVNVAATTNASTVFPVDVAIVLVSANSTALAGQTASRLLAPGGFVLSLQNGIGNFEALAEVLGEDRVMAGLSYDSAALSGIGHATHTHAGPTWIGERDGSRTKRLDQLFTALSRSGLKPVIVDDIVGFIWDKWVLNSAINAVAAITGLRLGEISRTPPVDEFQTRIIDEILLVVAAKGIRLHDADIKETIKQHCWKKYNKPSMLQHIEAGKRTEIDALNGAVVREGKALGVPTPFNEALTLLIKGLEKSRAQALHGPSIDYEKLEAEAAKGPAASAVT